MDLQCTGELSGGLFVDDLRACAGDGVARIDLRPTTWIDPIGLVALSVFMERQTDLGRQVNLLAPTDGSIENYASRMNLGHMVDLFGGRHNLRTVRRANHSADLLELQAFDSEEAVARLAELLFDKVHPTEGLEVARSLHQAVSELGVNVPNHSGRAAGYVAAQSTYNGKIIKFAVGDAGIGLSGSLGPAVDSDLEAMELVMEGGVSRTGLIGRGTGIRSTRDHVTGMGGVLVAQSGIAVSVQTPSRSDFRTRAVAVPGVLMQGVLDFR